MDLSTVTVADFKAFFRRDFPYAPATVQDSVCSNLDKYIFDFDIEKAFNEAKALLNQALFPNDDVIRIAYLYLSAHYLANDMKTALQGIESTGTYPVNSRSVGNVSESYTVPDKYLDNPQLAFFASTGYGNKYLSLVLPALVGNVGSVCGWTNP